MPEPGDLLVPDDPAGARTGYAICATGRSGSSWFAKLLASTSELGQPQDFFNTPYQRRLYGTHYPADRHEQTRLILTEGRTPNGVYGLKLFPLNLRNAAQSIAWTQLLPQLRFIHWRRRDLLGQALSRHRAFQTQAWRSTHHSRSEPLYDGEAIREAIEWIAIQDARWEVFFARNGIEPLRLVYEDAMASPQEAVTAVARLVGLDGGPTIHPARIELEIQRDALTEEWRTRFLQDFRNPDDIDEL